MMLVSAMCLFQAKHGYQLGRRCTDESPSLERLRVANESCSNSLLQLDYPSRQVQLIITPMLCFALLYSCPNAHSIRCAPAQYSTAQVLPVNPMEIPTRWEILSSPCCFDETFAILLVKETFCMHVGPRLAKALLAEETLPTSIKEKETFWLRRAVGLLHHKATDLTSHLFHGRRASSAELGSGQPAAISNPPGPISILCFVALWWRGLTAL
eukprot:1149098-Pelagomonas_calceolata.AAC.1